MTKAVFTKRNGSGGTGGLKWLILAVVVIVLLFLANFLATHHTVIDEYYEPKEEVGKSPFYTANFILKKQGKEAVLLGNTDDTPLRQIWADKNNAKGKVLVIQDIDVAQENDVQAMLDWTMAGGHLISFSKKSLATTPSNEELIEYYKNENPLLLALGASRRDYEVDHTKYDEKLEGFVQDKVPLRLPTGERLVVSTSYQQTFFEDGFEAYAKQLAQSNNLEATRLLDKYNSYSHIRQGKQVYEYALLGKTANTLTTFVNDLSDAQKKRILGYHKYDPYYFLSKRAVYDVKVGQGRISLFADFDGFLNPSVNGHFIDEWQEDKNTQKKDKKANSLFFEKLSSYGNDYDTTFHTHYSSGIMSLDNAYFLNDLTKNATHIWFVANFKRPRLSELLWANVPFLLIGIGLTLALGLLALPRQFGATKVYQDDVAFNLFHLFAQTGNFLWRTDKMTQQIAQNRTALLEKIAPHLPKLMSLQNETDICMMIGEHSGLGDELVYEALYGQWQNEKEFLMVCQALIKLSNHY